MMQSTIVRWSDPKVILVATNLVEDHTFMLHAIYQATLSRAKVLLVHVIPSFQLREEAVYWTPCSQPSLRWNSSGKESSASPSFSTGFPKSKSRSL